MKILFPTAMLLVVLSTLAAQQPPVGAPEATEEVIRQLAPNSGRHWIFGTIYHFQEGDKILWAEAAGLTWEYFLDGRSVGRYHFDKALVKLSPSGKLVYFLSRGKNKWILQVDQAERGTVEGESIVDVQFDPQCEIFAVEIRVSPIGPYHWVVRGEKGPDFENLGQLVTTPDQKHFAYAGSTTKTGFVSGHVEGALIVDGKQQTQQRATPPGDLFRPAMRDWHEGQVPVVDGVGDPSMTSDGRRLAYAIHRDKKDEAVIVDGEFGPKFEAIVYGPWFSQDGKHFFYTATNDNYGTLLEVRDHKVVRETKLPDFNYFGVAAITEDFSRFAFVLGKGGQVSATSPLSHRRVVVDGKVGQDKKCMTTDRLQFSPDGRHLSYQVTVLSGRKEHAYVVMDGKQGKEYDYIISGSARFLEDRFEYIAREGDKLVRVMMKLD
jgi:hypothetical protein